MQSAGFIDSESYCSPSARMAGMLDYLGVKLLEVCRRLSSIEHGGILSVYIKCSIIKVRYLFIDP